MLSTLRLCDTALSLLGFQELDNFTSRSMRSCFKDLTYTNQVLLDVHRNPMPRPVPVETHVAQLETIPVLPDERAHVLPVVSLSRFLMRRPQHLVAHHLDLETVREGAIADVQG